MSSEKKDQGMIAEFQSFCRNSKNFITSCEKPDRKGMN